MSDNITIKNINNYIQKIVGNDLILIPKYIQLPDDEFLSSSFTKSEIIYCSIKNRNKVITEKIKYQAIIVEIWKSMLLQDVLKHTTYNIKTSKEEKRNYMFNKDMQIYFQSKDSNGAIKEIINLVKINNFKINIQIKLQNGEIINYRN